VRVRGLAGVALQFRCWRAELGSTVAFLPHRPNVSICPRAPSALRLAAQDAALSRRKHGFDSRRARQGQRKTSVNPKHSLAQGLASSERCRRPMICSLDLI
jgi:hypothetical protein